MDEQLINRIEKYFSLLSKYPDFVKLSRNDSFMNYAIGNEFLVADNQNHEFEDVETKFFELMNNIIDVFEDIETQITSEENKIHHKVPVFNFNPDLVIAHSRKITKASNRIIYLNMVLEYWENHLPRRYHHLKTNIELLNKSFLQNYKYFTTKILEKLKQELEVENLPFPKYLESFDEKINFEIRTLSQLQSEDDENVLEAINNPPGTKKRQWKETEVDEVNEVVEDKKLSEWMTSDEVKGFLKISNTTLYNYRKKGILKEIKISRKNYYKRKDVINLLESKQK